jgi:hypothetical protein
MWWDTPSNGGWTFRVVLADGTRFGCWTVNRCEGVDWARDLIIAGTPLPKRST